jgi:hypothetical protein
MEPYFVIYVIRMHGQKKSTDTVLAIAETLIVLVDVAYSDVAVLMYADAEILGIDTSKIKKKQKISMKCCITQWIQRKRKSTKN